MHLCSPQRTWKHDEYIQGPAQGRAESLVHPSGGGLPEILFLFNEMIVINKIRLVGGKYNALCSYIN